MVLKDGWSLWWGVCLHRNMKGKGSGVCLHRNMKGKGSGVCLHRNMKGKGSGVCLHRNMKGNGSFFLCVCVKQGWTLWWGFVYTETWREMVQIFWFFCLCNRGEPCGEGFGYTETWREKDQEEEKKKKKREKRKKGFKIGVRGLFT